MTKTLTDNLIPLSRCAEISEGEASPVLLLHSSGASHSQWRGFLSSYSQTRQCFAPDLIGYGSTQDQSGEPFSIDREVALIEEATSGLSKPFHVVGHSYGGCIALRYAQRNTASVRSLTLIEPVLFNLLKSDLYQSDWEEVSKLANKQQSFVKADQLDDAAELFIDYWCGAGFWQSMPPGFRDHVSKLMPKVALELQQIWVESNNVEALQSMTAPTCLVQGALTRRPTATIIQILSKALRNSEIKLVEGAGHMCPITHGEIVNDLIGSFLSSTERDQTDLQDNGVEQTALPAAKQYEAHGV